MVIEDLRVDRHVMRQQDTDRRPLTSIDIGLGDGLLRPPGDVGGAATVVDGDRSTAAEEGNSLDLESVATRKVIDARKDLSTTVLAHWDLIESLEVLVVSIDPLDVDTIALSHLRGHPRELIYSDAALDVTKLPAVTEVTKLDDALAASALGMDEERVDVTKVAMSVACEEDLHADMIAGTTWLVYRPGGFEPSRLDHGRPVGIEQRASCSLLVRLVPPTS